jgi:hypothetical protein
MKGLEPSTFCMASELRRLPLVATYRRFRMFWPNPSSRRTRIPPPAATFGFHNVSRERQLRSHAARRLSRILRQAAHPHGQHRGLMATRLEPPRRPSSPIRYWSTRTARAPRSTPVPPRLPHLLPLAGVPLFGLDKPISEAGCLVASLPQ